MDAIAHAVRDAHESYSRMMVPVFYAILVAGAAASVAVICAMCTWLTLQLYTCGRVPLLGFISPWYGAECPWCGLFCHWSQCSVLADTVVVFAIGMIALEVRLVSRTPTRRAMLGHWWAIV